MAVISTMVVVGPITTHASAQDAVVHKLVGSLLAGSNTHAVYTLWTDADGQTGIQQLTARAASGETTDLGTYPARFEEGGVWSTEGRWIAAAVVGTTSQATDRMVDVWNIRTRRHRVVQLPAPTSWLAATPRGFVYVRGGQLHEWVARQHGFTSLGKPFDKQDIATVTTDDRELVVTGERHGGRVMRFAKAGHFEKLDVGKRGQCFAVDHLGAACSIGYGSPITFVPLDGGAATIGRTFGGGGYCCVAISGDHILYVDSVSDTTYLFGFRAGDPLPNRSAEAVGERVITAYGKALMLRPYEPDETPGVYGATSPKRITLEFTP